MAYIFDPAVIHEAVRLSIGQPIEDTIETLAAELNRRYPGHILPERKWILNNAGGAMGHMLLLHSSLTEYLLIFGTPIGTTGHTGRYWAEDHFFILEGEHWVYHEGDMDKRVYRPGDVTVLRRGEAGGYRMPDRCYALEYARGIIPSMLPFGIGDTISSTFDFRTLARTFGHYGRSVVRELLQGKV